uniref:MFS transporter, PPP family, 3-phenylpropionic acid transporter n=1 Tax=Candidatus Kentrum eta TaxID=2126337 RepID=A0A450VCG5_9GAMM|nr:MAG: MFS transporter, PPP family, 3-phenylpropionic acid transporter [Candidatus Kentron sp. H]VFJ96646.1 MAG: MFS transporter, PPP family, 3-phenylpropionic acid transporter [Candidatus Kentron sp. H]VFK02476.1 MAG: MFS transporter, PPP family, 3-phenylpropionic acid transporter [Candidatus Kentron sp. H]
MRFSPYWPISGFYFFYFAAMGVLMPYLGLYLQSLGFCPRQIGAVLAMLYATKIVAPVAWGWLADRRGERAGLIRMAAALSIVAFVGVYFPAGGTFPWLMLVMAVFGFFWNAALPHVEAITLDHLGDHTHRYGRIRLWGSIGFILTVLLFGGLLAGYDVRVVLHGTLALLVGILLSALFLSDHGGHLPHREPGPLGEILRQPRVLALFGACFLMLMSHAPHYAFYSIYLDEYLYDPTTIGQLWALGVCAEVAFFLIMPWVLKRVGLRGLFLGSFAVAGPRWLLVALFPSVLWVQAFSQLLHAVTFGVYHTVAILLIHRFFVGNHQGQGQALYNSVSFGAGYAMGALGGGFLWFHFGGEFTYLVAMGVTALAFGVAWRWVRE